MFCPSCGFESTQRTNYCKRCGESLSVSTSDDPPKAPRLNLAIMFCVVAAFGLIGLFTVYQMYDTLVIRGLRGDALMLPFMLGIVFVSAITGLLVWQLSRMITAYQRMNKNVVVERHFIREVPQGQLGVPTDQISQPVDIPSVVEHTTRQFADKYRESGTPK